MKIRGLNAKELEEFIHSEEFALMPNIPISRHRALSHIHNPRMEADDILLFIGYIDGEMAGYLGILPDVYFINDTPHKFGWISCMWMNEKMRGMGVTQELIAEALQKWDGRIIVTEITSLAKTMFIITGFFQEWFNLQGFRGYAKGNLHEILPKRKPIFQKMKLALKLADGMINVLSALKPKMGLKNSKNIRIERIQALDEDSLQFIKQREQNEFNRRGSEAGWMMAWPWVLSSEKGDFDPLQSRYYFSSIDKGFEFQLLKIYEQDRLLSVALIAIRNNHLKIPYIYFRAADTEKIVKAIYGIIRSEHIGTFTTYNHDISTYMQTHDSPFIYKKGINRVYLITPKLFEELPLNFPICLQDGDGDCVFT